MDADVIATTMGQCNVLNLRGVFESYEEDYLDKLTYALTLNIKSSFF
jgi:hypothetical protein